MTNLEIAQRIAEAMGHKMTVDENCVQWLDNGDIFYPTDNMLDAWEVAERFGLTDLMAVPDEKWRASNMKWSARFATIEAKAETAPLAICKAALKVIEGSESDE